MPEHSASARAKAATVHLVRHAETLWDEQGRMQGAQDSPLTSAGRYRSTLLAADLHEEPFEAVYAAPSLSAVDTARIVVAGRDLAVATRPDLREMPLGAWEGRKHEELAREEPDRYLAYRNRPDRFVPQGGESFAAARERVRACVDGLMRAHRGGSILIVSHATVLQLLLGSLEGRTLGGLWKAPELRPGSRSVVRGAGLDRARILRYAGLAWPHRAVRALDAATMPA